MVGGGACSFSTGFLGVALKPCSGKGHLCVLPAVMQAGNSFRVRSVSLKLRSYDAPGAVLKQPLRFVVVPALCCETPGVGQVAGSTRQGSLVGLRERKHTFF